MPEEHEVQTAILKFLGARGLSRLFRNNRGMKGHVQFGLCPGASDVIGWKSVKVKPGMVGQRIAVFAALEVKGPTGKATPEQQEFLRLVDEAGGIAAVVRSMKEAVGVMA
jgi:hypothetical protein